MDVPGSPYDDGFDAFVAHHCTDALATGTMAAGGTLGILIPPSIILIVYGVATEQSIARLFIAGVLPGAMLVCLFGGYVMLRAWMSPASRLAIRLLFGAPGHLKPVKVCCSIISDCCTGARNIGRKILVVRY